MPVIKNNIQRPPSAIGVDIMQEERSVEFFFSKVSLRDINLS